MAIHNFIGITGVVLILAAYLLLQLGKLDSGNILFSGVNALGAILILYSLYFDRNLPSIVIEIAWLLISIVGLSRGLYKRRQNTHTRP